MNVMVMDVEGTDGRERGEDQVRVVSRHLCRFMTLFATGLRAEIRALFSCVV